MRINGVVFDMDGLMFDTETLTYELQKPILKERGIDYTLDWYKQTVGKRSEDIVLMFKELCGDGFDYEEFRVRCREAYQKYTDKFGVPIKDGLFELLDYLREKGIKTALCTSTTEPSAKRTLRISGTLKYFDALVCADDVSRGKPHPDPFLKAAEKLGLKPEECLALEDSINGIKSAHAAGMITVMIPDLIEPTDEIRPMCYKILPSLKNVIEII
ncbi:MAG: HAD family phosphatase [Ruminococcus sp.]|nr:HAD family phosphatase [Ruminococcus sp.]